MDYKLNKFEAIKNQNNQLTLINRLVRESIDEVFKRMSEQV